VKIETREQLYKHIRSRLGKVIIYSFSFVFLVIFLLVFVLGITTQFEMRDLWSSFYLSFGGALVYAVISAVGAVLGQLLIGGPLYFFITAFSGRTWFAYMLTGTVVGAFLLGVPFYETAHTLVKLYLSIWGAVIGAICALIGWLEVRHLPLPKDLKS